MYANRRFVVNVYVLSFFPCFLYLLSRDFGLYRRYLVDFRVIFVSDCSEGFSNYLRLPNGFNCFRIGTYDFRRGVLANVRVGGALRHKYRFAGERGLLFRQTIYRGRLFDLFNGEARGVGGVRFVLNRLCARPVAHFRGLIHLDVVLYFRVERVNVRVKVRLDS